ncbi:hypothetical protein OIU76_013691 [Salix suchowensis]|uniref:DUF2232 domain-containing protein n=1 Tax=Salix suchowensis TaxID=1278906 RepID=A0ABQ9A373_9ROSI|nr:DUF2232 domain-containing protein [Salix suchowensis]KAJ6318200.1 hypothetical protein OIU76_013691 [Salix suchowensis]KAJ6322170.1 hypothetical protein OIU77_012110 [Salix suchowensis]KAJ6350824.1 hypothetical protein OIU78_006863 [Salix suchowensis]
MKIMNILQIHNLKPRFPYTFRTVPHHSLSGSLNLSFRKSTPLSSSSFLLLLVTPIRPTFKIFTVSRIETPFFDNKKEDEEEDEERNLATNIAELEDLAPEGVVYQSTLRLVECSMFAAVTGLVYFLSNSLSIENYFGCFFSLPIVISSLRWGVAGGRKTMVATAMLLFVLSGPVKALTYLLTHGLVGFTMGSLWRMGANWGLSIFLCTIARATGAVGYVLTTSFLIRENIFALITINIHASLTFIFSAAGINTVPSMSFIYALFGILVVLNSGFFVFLLHLLYSVFLTRLGMKDLLRLPRWLEKAL